MPQFRLFLIALLKNARVNFFKKIKQFLFFVSCDTGLNTIYYFYKQAS
jgi:hypothetical protein